jgi:hypothetical protein
MARLHPNDVLNRLTGIGDAWQTLRPTKSFAGFTLDGYRSYIQPSIDVRDEIASLRAQLKAALARRAVVDKVSLKGAQCVIHSVAGDPEEGRRPAGVQVHNNLVIKVSIAELTTEHESTSCHAKCGASLVEFLVLAEQLRRYRRTHSCVRGVRLRARHHDARQTDGIHLLLLAPALVVCDGMPTTIVPWC